MKTVLELLKGGMQRIQDRANWCQRSYARRPAAGETDASSVIAITVSVTPDNTQATQWCAVGALLAEAGEPGIGNSDSAIGLSLDHPVRLAKRALSRAVARNIGSGIFDDDLIVRTNDAPLGDPHRAVLAAYEAAIREAEKK